MHSAAATESLSGCCARVGRGALLFAEHSSAVPQRQRVDSRADAMAARHPSVPSPPSPLSSCALSLSTRARLTDPTVSVCRLILAPLPAIVGTARVRPPTQTTKDDQQCDSIGRRTEPTTTNGTTQHDQQPTNRETQARATTTIIAPLRARCCSRIRRDLSTSSVADFSRASFVPAGHFCSCPLSSCSLPSLPLAHCLVSRSTSP